MDDRHACPNKSWLRTSESSYPKYYTNSIDIDPISEETPPLSPTENVSLSLSSLPFRFFLFLSPPLFKIAQSYARYGDTAIDYRETDILDSRFLEDSGFVGERCTHQLTWRSGPRHINRTENQQRPSADGAGKSSRGPASWIMDSFFPTLRPRCYWPKRLWWHRPTRPVIPRCFMI